MTKVFAYIDETGDLGVWNPDGPNTTSPHFGMACVLMTEAGRVQSRALIEELRAEFKASSSKKAFSWKNHVRAHDERQYVADRLAGLDQVTVLYVYVVKAAVTRGTYTANTNLLYNYVAGKMFKNILWSAPRLGAQAKELEIRFSHMKGFDHGTITHPYLTGPVARGSRLNLDLVSVLKWVDPAAHAESDVADLFGGCLNSALRPGKWGYVEGDYLRRVWPRVRNRAQCHDETTAYCAVPTGFMPMPSYDVANETWFPCQPCLQVRGRKHP